MKFRLLSHNEDQVKVKVTSPADFIYKTVWVTRGEDHRMTIEMRDNRTFSFCWGASGFTLISENLKNSRKRYLLLFRAKIFLLSWINRRLAVLRYCSILGITAGSCL